MVSAAPDTSQWRADGHWQRTAVDRALVSRRVSASGWGGVLLREMGVADWILIHGEHRAILLPTVTYRSPVGAPMPYNRWK